VHIKVPTDIEMISQSLEKAGFEAYLVGGCVRDSLIGRTPKDWDITTNATPEQIQKIFPDSFYDNNFGTVGIKNKTENETLKIIQITPYRKEGKYSDNRRPDKVTFSDKIEDDLSRRDFTINAIAYRTTTEKIVDLCKGQEDISLKILRTVGDPDTRFKEDALRILRAVRLSCEIGFAVSQETAASLVKNSHLLANISTERIRDEFIKILQSGDIEYGIMLLKQFEILKYIIPELEEGVGMEQTQAHAFDVFTHIIRSTQAAADKKWPLEIRLAALMHDIGKPRTRRSGGGIHKWTFYGHDVVGSKMARVILERLKFSHDTIEKVTKLVRWHMFFSDTELITKSAVRRMIVQVGKDNIWDLMNLRVCDRIGTGRPKESPYRLRKYHSMIEEVLRDPISVCMLKVDGKRVIDLTQSLAGPRVGWILHALLEDVLEDPAKNTIEYLDKKIIELSKLTDTDLRKIGEEAKSKKDTEENKAVEEIRGKHFVK